MQVLPYKQTYIIYGIIAITFGLYLHNLASDSFWGDEILTATYASRSSADIIRWTAQDIHPPLYYLVAGGLVQAILSLSQNIHPSQTSDWLWRFPSVIAVVVSLAITYRVVFHGLALAVQTKAKRFNLVTVTLMLLAVAPIGLKYGQEARMHALFMALSIASTWCLFEALSHPNRIRWWIAYSITTAANLYTVYFGFLILACQIIFFGLNFFIPYLTKARPLRGIRPLFQQTPLFLCGRFVGSVALAFLLYLPWFPVLFKIVSYRASVGAIEGGVGTPITFLTGVVQALGPLPLYLAWLFFALFVIGLIFLAQYDWPLAIFAGLWLGLPAMLPILLGDPRALQFRYAFVLPIYLLVIVYGSWRLVETSVTWLRLSQNSTNAIWRYTAWLLITVSFMASLQIYNQTKPNWRAAAYYLDEHTQPADLILVGPLWDEGRFINYYYRGQAQRLTPAAFVHNIDGYTTQLRQGNGRLWAVNRFAPQNLTFLQNQQFSGVVVSKATLNVYESDILSQSSLMLAEQAVDAAYPWATSAEAQGVISPDPRTAKAIALKAWGDTLVAAHQPEQAVTAYQTAVDIFPGWSTGFRTLAETHETVGNLPAAAQAYQQAVQFNPQWRDNPTADSAANFVDTAQWSKAIEQYHQIIQ